LRAPRRALVAEECLKADDGDSAAIELESVSRAHRLLEGDAIRTVQDIDAARRHTDLQDAVIGCEITLGDLELGEGGTERRECCVDATSIVRHGANQHIEVLGCTGMPMKRYGVPTDDHEVGSCVSELNQKIPEVFR